MQTARRFEIGVSDAKEALPPLTPEAPQALTAREALNGAVLAAMIASYLVIVFLVSA
jgi:hypothetical protein